MGGMLAEGTVVRVVSDVCGPASYVSKLHPSLKAFASFPPLSLDSSTLPGGLSAPPPLSGLPPCQPGLSAADRGVPWGSCMPWAGEEGVQSSPTQAPPGRPAGGWNGASSWWPCHCTGSRKLLCLGGGGVCSLGPCLWNEAAPRLVHTDETTPSPCLCLSDARPVSQSATAGAWGLLKGNHTPDPAGLPFLRRKGDPHYLDTRSQSETGEKGEKRFGRKFRNAVPRCGTGAHGALRLKGSDKRQKQGGHRDLPRLPRNRPQNRKGEARKGASSPPKTRGPKGVSSGLQRTGISGSTMHELALALLPAQ
ncbi:uncharacterized protein LOC123817392 [Phyllostomus hastatus]|uniref:uncharacterized protein LOC123817392 n=1 Tax=Phyllostomus hastatus TaxID=9423 RepID=UPI001E68250B|nr:uncharacterized protein LOC123817392 [Phyllostomus hastatus]